MLGMGYRSHQLREYGSRGLRQGLLVCAVRCHLLALVGRSRQPEQSIEPATSNLTQEPADNYIYERRPRQTAPYP